MLTELVIEGLRGVGRVELRLQPGQRVYTFFGVNGIGKTKCLEAMYQYLLLANRVFLAQRKIAVKPDFLVMKSFQWAGRPNLNKPERDAISLGQVWPQAEKGGFHDEPIVLLGARNRSALALREGPSGMLGTFSDRRKKYFDRVTQQVMHGRLAEAGMSEDVPSWFVLRAQSDNRYQKDADNRRVEIDAVLGVLHDLDSRIDSSFLQIDGGGRVFIQVEGQPRALDELSSGFTSLVKMVQAIVSGYASFSNESQLRHVRGVVLIDEIESHLHARWQSSIIPHLTKIFHNTTFYIATHSPLVLAQLQEGEAYLLERSSDGVVRSSVVDSPNRRAFADVLESAFDIDLNALKRQSLELDDQTAAKSALLDLLGNKGGRA